MSCTKKQRKKRFVATVEEVFKDTFVIRARNEEEARRIIDDGIPDEYSPVQTGGGYQRYVRVDADE